MMTYQRLIGAVFALAATAILAPVAAVQGAVAPTTATVIPRIDGVPARAPHARPAIYAVNMPLRHIHSGDTVHAIVVTSSNVASVEARIRGFGMNLEHVGVGRFATDYHVPWLPFFLHGHWPVSVIARNVDGVATQKTIYISYQ